MPGEGPSFLAGGEVPQPHHAIRASRRQGLAVGTERYGLDCCGEPLEGRPLLAGGKVPQLNRLVITRGSERLTVRAECHGPDHVVMFVESVPYLRLFSREKRRRHQGPNKGKANPLLHVHHFSHTYALGDRRSRTISPPFDEDPQRKDSAAELPWPLELPPADTHDLAGPDGQWT